MSTKDASTLPTRRRHRLWRRRAFLGAVFVVGMTPFLPACGRPAPGGLVSYGPMAAQLAMASVDPESGSWETAPWSPGETGWLPYPPRGQIQITHPLGRVPQTVLVYLSFDPSGTSPGLAAGDLARVIDANETTVTIWNDTNGSFFARVVLR